MSRAFNKYTILTVIFLIVFMAISFAMREEMDRFAIYEANKQLNQMLTNQQALHVYVKNIQKPVIFKLKKEGKLSKDFFDAKLLSFVYIAENIHKIENNIFRKNGQTQKYYKLASDNPTDPINKASEEESRLLKLFKQDRNLKAYKKIIVENSKKYLYFAKPISPNTKSCLGCHGEPSFAPKKLVQKYGEKAGFYEKQGNIRAIISIKIPLQKELQLADSYYNKIILFLLFVLLAVYFTILYLFKKLDNRNKILIELSSSDVLTKCLNRRMFSNDINRAISYSKRNNSPLTLIMYDIDYFKRVNDRFGHQIGDKVLVELSSLVSKNLREYNKLYRIGGEEFIIICKNTKQEEGFLLAQRLRTIAKEHPFDTVGHITISLGVCEYDPKMDEKELFKNVDDALYTSKKSGRDIVSTCN